ncbi:hypothetical protein ACTWPT_24210 [Nonomuraea sp. 3N208]|uniref:hypothetical protein n=1 Tax=Nonomuraea sp. 3N208 TaxID=3457421 RepID=UPI003FD03DDD
MRGALVAGGEQVAFGVEDQLVEVCVPVAAEKYPLEPVVTPELDTAVADVGGERAVAAHRLVADGHISCRSPRQ